MTTLETRIISNKGLLRVPQNNDLKKAKILTLHADVIRRPNSEYVNYQYSPAKSRYANLNFVRDGYVMQQVALEYATQMWEWHPELPFQGVYATECAYQGTLISFVNLGVALGATPVSVTNHIKDWRHSRLWFDEIFVKCYAETAVRLVLSSTPYDLCPDQDATTAPPPPPPPPPPPNYPPGTPLSDTATPASPPYEGTDDEGDTVPFPGDEQPQEGGDPGDTQSCARYGVGITFRQFPGGDPIPVGVAVYGRVGDVRIRVEGEYGFLDLWCGGRAQVPGDECLPEFWYFIRGVDPRSVDAVKTSVTLLSPL